MYPNNFCNQECYPRSKTRFRLKCKFHRKVSMQHVCKDFSSSLIFDETGKYRKPVEFQARIVIAWLIVLCETKRNETKWYFAKRLQHNASSHLI